MLTSSLTLAIIITLLTCLLTPGIILFIKGRPYKNILLAIHLLLSFGFMIFIGIRLYNNAGDTHTLLISIISISFILLLLTGFLMIRERYNRLLMILIHLLATLGLLGSLGCLIFG